MIDRLPWFRCFPEKLLNALAQMTPDQMLVYQIVLLRIYETGRACADSVEALATRCKMNRRRITDALDALFRAGKLARADGGIMNPFAATELQKQREISAERKRAGAAGGSSTQKKHKQNQQTRQANGLAKSEQTLSSSPLLPLEDSLGLKEDSEERSSGLSRIWDFDQFWRQYPHKVGKGAALKAFNVVMKKKNAIFDDVMLGLMRYAAKTDDRPWCNPATWLNQERWLDEPAPNGGSNAKRDETVAERGARLADRARELEHEGAARRARHAL